MTKTKVLICPYCGETQTVADRCCACGGLLDPLSRQATHNQMGPWFVRHPERPFQPGCSYETLIKMIERGQVTKNSIIRGPTTTQFWNAAKRVPGVAHLLGYCHSCDAAVDPTDFGCHACGVPFGAFLDRNFYGLPEIRPLPGEIGGPAVTDSADVDSPSRPLPTPRPAATEGFSDGRLSSFASDDELRNGPSIPAGTFTAGSIPAAAGSGVPDGPDDGQASPDHTGAPPAGPAIDPFLSGSTSRIPSIESTGALPSPGVGDVRGDRQDWVTSPAMRAMQRKVSRQSQTIRVMTIAVVVLGVVAVILGAMALLSRPGAAADGRQAGAAPDQDQPAAVEPSTLDQAAGDQATTPQEPVPAEDLSDPDAADAPPPDDEEAEAVPEPSEDDLTNQRALELTTRADDASRPPADRLADYRRALVLLEELAGKIPAGPDADELAARIEYVRQAIDRLEVDDYING